MSSRRDVDDQVFKVLRGEAEPEADAREALKSLDVLMPACMSARDGKRVAWSDFLAFCAAVELPQGHDREIAVVACQARPEVLRGLHRRMNRRPRPAAVRCTGHAGRPRRRPRGRLQMINNEFRTAQRCAHAAAAPAQAATVRSACQPIRCSGKPPDVTAPATTSALCLKA